MQYQVRFIKTGRTFGLIPQIKMNDTFNEELDMYEFTLSTLSYRIDNELDFKKWNGLIPMQILVNGKLVKQVYLSYYKYSIVSYNPIKYKYLIQATSETFLLQRITLPNKLITQPIEGTKRTVFQELMKILEVYAPNLYNDYDKRLEDLMNVPCPQLHFVKSTLHEVLIDLFAVCGLVPKITLGVLSFTNLRGNNTNIDFSNFIRVEGSNNISNYADMLDYDIENAISEEEDVETAWIAPTSDEAIVTTENYFWKLPTEAYDVLSVELNGRNIQVKPTLDDDWIDLDDEAIDITYYVVPKVVYDTLKLSSKVEEKGAEYKRNNLFFEGDRIDGATFTETNWLPGTFKPAIVNVALRALNDLAILPGMKGVKAVRINDFRKTLMKVRYKTKSENARIKIVKTGIKKPVNNLISNQDSSFIDIINFGKQKKELINRLGNDEILAQGNYKLNDSTLDEIPQLGDHVNKDYIITEREMQFNENTLLANFKLTKNYVFQTGYSGLKQLKRFTSIDTKGTVIRNDNVLYNLQFAFTKEGNEDYLINKCLDNYGSYFSYGATLHYFRTYFNDGGDSEVLLLTSQNKHIADSIYCQMGFKHNYVAGDSIEEIKDKFLKKPITYTDDNGEFRTARVYFGEAEERRDWDFYPEVRCYPESFFYDSAKHYNYTELLLNKDNREITNITFQFRMFGDKGIYLYENFYKYTQLTAHTSTTFKVYFAWNKDLERLEKYNENTVTPIGQLTTSSKVLFGKNKQGNKQRCITITDILSDFGYYAIGVTDLNGRLLFGVNYTHVSSESDLTLWLNEL